jgi:hypothetical protein
MPIEIQFSDHGEGVVLRAFGAVSGAEYTNTVLKFFRGNLERLATIRYRYSDHAEANGLDLTMDDLQQLAEASLQLAQLNGILAVAIYSPQNFHFGLSRMWTAFAERTGWQKSVLHIQSEAKRWLWEIVSEDLTFQ